MKIDQDCETSKNQLHMLWKNIWEASVNNSKISALCPQPTCKPGKDGYHLPTLHNPSPQPASENLSWNNLSFMLTLILTLRNCPYNALLKMYETFLKRSPLLARLFINSAFLSDTGFPSTYNWCLKKLHVNLHWFISFQYMGLTKGNFVYPERKLAPCFPRLKYWS